MICRALSLLALRQAPAASDLTFRGVARFMSSWSSKGDGMSDDRGGAPPPPDKPPTGNESDKAAGSGMDDMFSEENTRHLGPHDLARLRLMYGLVREHVDATQRGIDEVDPDSNPLLDPRSFSIRKLPRLPDEVLQHFRRELPAEIAARSWPVGTRAVWEEPRQDGDVSDIVVESTTAAMDWQRVDERTMPRHSLARRARLPAAAGAPAGMSGAGASTTSASRTPGAGGNAVGGGGTGNVLRLPEKEMKRRSFHLWDKARRRIFVDFKCVATLQRYLSGGSKILPRRKTGLGVMSHKRVSKAVKTARMMALLHPEPKGGITLEEMRQIAEEMEGRAS